MTDETESYNPNAAEHRAYHRAYRLTVAALTDDPLLIGEVFFEVDAAPEGPFQAYRDLLQVLSRITAQSVGQQYGLEKSLAMLGDLIAQRETQIDAAGD